eukprot:654664-Rhodomonas_salina.2
MPLTVLTDPKFQLKGHTYWVRSVCFSPDGELIATACADKNLRMFNAAGSERSRTRPRGSESRLPALTGERSRCLLLALLFLPILTLHEGRRVRLLEASTGREIVQMKDHSSTVNAVCFSSDGSMLLSGSYDKTAKIFSVADG